MGENIGALSVIIISLIILVACLALSGVIDFSPEIFFRGVS